MLVLAASRREFPELCRGRHVGTLPLAAWANLSSMRTFAINNNFMTGTLPHELATAWPDLASLDLSYNGFSGKDARTHASRCTRVDAGASSDETCSTQLTGGAICRHHPEGLVHVATAVSQRA